jgi:hypothetical protein
MTLARYSYWLFLFGLIFGVVFYDFIGVVFNFNYIDELLALFLFLGYCYRCVFTKTFNREFGIVLVIFLFYLVYSLYVHTNVAAAIWMDFFILIKPFLAFYSFYEIAPSFTVKQRRYIRQLCLLFGAFVFVLGLWPENPFLEGPRLATATTILASTYLFCSERKRKDIRRFIILLAIGLLSFKSKHYAFFAASFGIFYLLKTIRLRSLFLSAFVLIPLMLWASWAKFNFYFIQGSQSENVFARPALFMGAWDLLWQYIPFGPGFGSYASFASAVFPSPLYYATPVLKMASEIQDGLFLCDAFFPQLAEFGLVGVFLFIVFWVIQTRKGWRNYFISYDVVPMKMVLLTVIFFAVESVADTTFTHNRGMFMMMLLALWLRDNRKSSNA